MSVLKDDGTKRLIDQILASLKVGKYAIMDKVLNINSSNPVENKVITASINNLSKLFDVTFEVTGAGIGTGTVTCDKSINDIVDRFENESLSIGIKWLNSTFKLTPTSVKVLPYGLNGAWLDIEGMVIGYPSNSIGVGETLWDEAIFHITYKVDGEGNIGENSVAYKYQPRIVHLEKTVDISTYGNIVGFNTHYTLKDMYTHASVISSGYYNSNGSKATNGSVDSNRKGFETVINKTSNNVYDMYVVSLTVPDILQAGEIKYYVTLLLH